MWIGAQVHPHLFRAAGEAAHRICKYDSAHSLALEAVDDGGEGPALAEALRSEDVAADAAAAAPKLRPEYDADYDTLDAALAELGAELPERGGCCAADLWSVGEGGGSWGSVTGASHGGLTARSHSTLTARQRSDGGSGGIAPVVPPLQLNTFPISPPLSSRTPKS